MTVTTQVPATRLDVGGTVSNHAPDPRAGDRADAGARASTRCSRCAGSRAPRCWPGRSPTSPSSPSARSRSACGDRRSRPTPRRCPKGEVVQALNQVLITARAAESGGRPGDQLQPARPAGPAPAAAVPAQQRRRPARTRSTPASSWSTWSIPRPSRRRRDGDRRRVAAPAGASAIELASWQGERRLVAPRLGSLGDRLAPLDDNVGARSSVDPVTPEPVDTTVHPPVALAVLGTGTPLEGMARRRGHDRVRPSRRRRGSRRRPSPV